jgi:hypothetical protein
MLTNTITDFAVDVAAYDNSIESRLLASLWSTSDYFTSLLVTPHSLLPPEAPVRASLVIYPPRQAKHHPRLENGEDTDAVCLWSCVSIHSSCESFILDSGIPPTPAHSFCEIPFGSSKRSTVTSKFTSRANYAPPSSQNENEIEPVKFHSQRALWNAELKQWQLVLGSRVRWDCPMNLVMLCPDRDSDGDSSSSSSSSGRGSVDGSALVHALSPSSEPLTPDADALDELDLSTSLSGTLTVDRGGATEGCGINTASRSYLRHGKVSE